MKTNIDKITKERYDEISDKYPPNKFVLFIYKYFSTQTEKKDLSLSNTIVGTLIALFFIGFIASFFNPPRIFTLLTVIPYYCLMFIFVITLFVGIKMNSYRVKKIYTELGLTINEYNVLTEKFYPRK